MLPLMFIRLKNIALYKLHCPVQLKLTNRFFIELFEALIIIIDEFI